MTGMDMNNDKNTMDNKEFWTFIKDCKLQKDRRRLPAVRPRCPPRHHCCGGAAGTRSGCAVAGSGGLACCLAPPAFPADHCLPCPAGNAARLEAS